MGLKKPKLLVVLSALGGGGAEKNVVRILPSLTGAFDVHLALGRRSGAFLHEVASTVTVHDLHARQMLLSGPALARLFWSIRPSLVMPVLEAPCMVTLATRRLFPKALKPKVVLNIQNNLSSSDRYEHRLRVRAVLGLRPFLYPSADAVIAISQGVRDDLAQLMPSLREKIRVVYNAGLDASLPVQTQEPVEHPAFSLKKPVLLACGRLIQQKGYGFLLDAFAQVRKRHDVHLAILGEGPERQSLDERIRRLAVTEHVSFLGFDSNPYKYMKRATVFVLSSLFEGFANVIVEAMACGLPVVATDCPSGPREILKGGELGRLVPPLNSAALADAISELLDDQAEQARLRKSGPLRAQDFSAEKIGAQYVRELSEVI